MEDRRKTNDRWKNSTIDSLNTWVSFGPVIRLLIVFAIIGGVLWMAVQIAGLILMLKLALTGS